SVPRPHYLGPLPTVYPTCCVRAGESNYAPIPGLSTAPPAAAAQHKILRRQALAPCASGSKFFSNLLLRDRSDPIRTMPVPRSTPCQDSLSMRPATTFALCLVAATAGGVTARMLTPTPSDPA